MAGNSPSITDWIGSIGTAAAFLVASGSFAYDRARRRKTDRLAQARLVDAWLALPKMGETEVRWQTSEGKITGERRSTLIFSGFISNASQQAIRDVRLDIKPGKDDSQPLFGSYPVLHGVVPPTLADKPFPWEVQLTAGEPWDSKKLELAQWGGYDLVVRFTDTTGQRWVRRPDGTLKPTADYDKEQADELAELERSLPPEAREEFERRFSPKLREELRKRMQ